MEDKLLDEIEDEVFRVISAKIEKNYHTLGLKYNPFPAAGIPKHSNVYTLDPETKETIIKFIGSTYSPHRDGNEGDYAGLAIVADFGMGKTHLMKYIMYQLQLLNENANNPDFSAISCFIDRPEDSPQKVIHKILDQIGIDTIRKYLWMILIEGFQKDPSFYGDLKPRTSLIPEQWDVLFEEPTKSNFLNFLNKFDSLKGDATLLRSKAKEIVKKQIVPDDEILAERYLNLIFPTKKGGDGWEILTGNKSSRDLQKKEVKFLNSVVEILNLNGFGMLYIFIDEFEDLVKIPKAKLTDYLLTLNTLINNERRWAVVITVTEDVFERIRRESPPLHDRLSTYVIRINQLTLDHAKNIVANYFNTAGEDKNKSISPFSDSLIKEMHIVSKGNYRSFIRLAHRAVEYGAISNLDYPLSADIVTHIKDA